MPQNPAFRIERATAADIDQCTDYWVTLACEQRTYGSHVLGEPNRQTIRATLGAHRAGDGLLVARLEGEPVGFVSFLRERGSFKLDVTRGLLSNLYVRPENRNQGIGTALLQAAEAALADDGVEVVSLEAMAANDAARRFYARHGYGESRVTLERRLPADENDTHSKE